MKHNYQITTYQYRIKDSNNALCKALMLRAGKVNYIWNYCNNLQIETLNKFNSGINNEKKWLSGFDLNNLTIGTSKILKIHSEIVNAVNEEYAKKRLQSKKPYLKFRTNKKNRNLPWIPFKSRSIKHLENGVFIVDKIKIKTWYSRNIPSNAQITNGSIVQNSLGQWFINITFKKIITENERLNLTSSGQNLTAIDPGLNPMFTLSIEEPDGKIKYKEIEPPKFYKNLEEKIKKAQRARRFKKAKKINKKILNQRKDYQYKLANELIKDNHTIVMGIVDLKFMIKNTLKGHAKSWHDIGFAKFKTILKTKAIKHNIVYEEIVEKKIKSTQKCSCCGKITGPKGLEGLSVSSWICHNPSCGVKHLRNRNSADNHRIIYKNKLKSQRDS